MLGNEFVQVVLDEDDGDDVLESLTLGIALELLFPDDLDDLRDLFVRITVTAHDGERERSVMIATGRPPGVVAFTAERILLPGNLPAADVLRAGGDSQGFRCFGIEPWQAFRHPLGIDDLARTHGAGQLHLPGILCVGRVDVRDDRVEAWRKGSHATLIGSSAGEAKWQSMAFAAQLLTKAAPSRLPRGRVGPADIGIRWINQIWHGSCSLLSEAMKPR